MCDDGSNDSSETLIRDFDDDRLIWICSPAYGQPAIPRNLGLRRARAEWLAFLDSDDIWLPNKLEKQLGILEEKRTKACCTNAYSNPTQGLGKPLLDFKKDIIRRGDTIKENLVINSTVVLHRSLLELVDGFPESVELKALEDYALWLKSHR